jgi:hypothetical protein
MSTRLPLDLLNADTATFECTFGSGCEGVCCRNGRPSLAPAERARVEENLAKFLPHLRPEARKAVEAGGFLTRRAKLGLPMARVAGGWCVFFNAGCVLHKVGLAEGDYRKYKPAQCVVFPLDQLPDGRWYVRQWGYQGEEWDLFCLDPRNSARRADQTLVSEMEYAARLAAGDDRIAGPDADSDA